MWILEEWDTSSQVGWKTFMIHDQSFRLKLGDMSQMNSPDISWIHGCLSWDTGIFHGIGHGICHAMYMQGTCKVLQVPSWPSWPSCWIHRSNPLKKPLGIVKVSTPSGDLAAWGKFGDNPRAALLHRQFLGCVRNLGDTLNLLPFSWGKLMLIFPDLFIWRFLGLI